MPITTTLTQIFQRHRAAFCVAFLILPSSLIGGCAARVRPAFPWYLATTRHPIIPMVTVTDQDPPQSEADWKPELPSATSLGAARMAPLKPHVAAPPPKEVVKEKPAPPSIAPEISVQVTSDAQEQANSSLEIAKKNLTSAQSKSLSAPQKDLLDKVRGFITNAQDAAGTGDWISARTLAKKAQVLSQELVSSP